MNSKEYDFAQKKLILILTSAGDYLDKRRGELRLSQQRQQNDSEGTTWVSECAVWGQRKPTTETILLVS